MKTFSTLALLIAADIALAAEPSDYIPLKMPEGALKVDSARIAIPLAHKAKSGLLLYENTRKDKLFCELRPDQASDLAGAQYKAIEGFKPILIKWAFIEPVDEKGMNLVIAHMPSVSSKDGVLYVSSSGIDIGDVGKVVEGVLIIQVATDPKNIVFKLSKIGW
ncbi:MAG TPA: hypothetical protein VF258_08935 [Luteolibacter sp.]